MKKPQCILLDIEGTTSSISFVYDEMFPFVREHLAGFLADHWDAPAVTDCLPLLAKELGFQSQSDWLDNGDVFKNQQQAANGVIHLMDSDVKATGLKKLQGAIWQSGFRSGELVAHLFDDVAPAIKTWKQAGISVRIYSSGSIEAQKLFFGHCVAGDLLPLFDGHYDTTIGDKKSAESYIAIAADVGLEPNGVLFISDVAAELDAATQSGMQVALSVRPGNQPVENRQSYFAIESFAEIQFVA